MTAADRRFVRLWLFALLLVSLAGGVLVTVGWFTAPAGSDALLFPVVAVLAVVGLHVVRPRGAR